jgi:IS1 family transposase
MPAFGIAIRLDGSDLLFVACFSTNTNKLTVEEKTQIISALVEGNSIRATCRMTNHSKGAVLKLLVEVGNACIKFHDERVKNVHSKRVQCDEIWSFCYAKQKNVPAGFQGEFGYGDVWTWTAIDADTKLIIGWFVGRRDGDCAYLFIKDAADRLANRVQLTTDGLKAYLEAVEGVFGCDIDYAMLVKLYGATQEETRYSPAVCIGSRIEPITGNPDRHHISTSYVERQNLTMRMQMRRFTRLTNAFSKKIENHIAMISLYFVYYNFVRIHQTLRVTPAMEAGLTLSPMSIQEIVLLSEKYQEELKAAATIC